MTSAIWVRVACMRAIRSEASIDGGTNSTGRIRLSSPMVLGEVDIGKVEQAAAAGACLLDLALLDAGDRVMWASTSRICTMPRGSSSVSA